MRILCIEPVPNGVKIALMVVLIFALIFSCIWFVITTTEETCKLWERIVSGTIALALLIGSFFSGFFVPNNLTNKYKYYVEIMDYNEVEEQLKDFTVTETHGNLAILEDK